MAYQLAVASHAEATDGVRLSFVDATAHDWMFGVLWHRHGLCRAGRPLWKLVNTLRQRRCMLHLLCQVCGRSAVDGDRIWWLLPEPPGVTGGGRQFTHAPPTCRSCIPRARVWCLRLGPESYIYTVRSSEPYGVVADLYRPAAGRKVVVVEHAVEVPLEAFRVLEYALATQLLVGLDGLQRTEWDNTGEMLLADGRPAVRPPDGSAERDADVSGVFAWPNPPDIRPGADLDEPSASSTPLPIGEGLRAEGKVIAPEPGYIRASDVDDFDSEFGRLVFDEAFAIGPRPVRGLS
ncbi:hypothetical protein [Nonomuraea rosea]|uniref:hypothetical protein n=1 Tax=Nonomuraea rosea TaxID=638574 RepID=UPI0031EAE495